ncbi:MAG: hypothetical protein ACE5HI_04690 [bacterium]
MKMIVILLVSAVILIGVLVVFYWDGFSDTNQAQEADEAEKIISVPLPPGEGGKRLPEGICRPTGCSGEICADKDMPVFSICLWKPEYACYRDAKCERQPDGECGWTKTLDLLSCLEQARATN